MATVLGTNGDDFLTSGTGGDDEYFGLAGDDILADYGGGDLFDGGPGSDTVLLDPEGELTGVFLTDAFFEVTVDLRGRFQSDGGIAGDSDELVSIENYTHLGTFDMTVLGDNGANILKTDKGSDRLEGRGGNDVLSAGPGDDTLSGGRGLDLLTGGTGADEFDFEFVTPGSLDTITDFDPTEDTLVFASSFENRLQLFEITDTADGALVSYGASAKNSFDVALLEGVAAADISVDDFAFL